MNGEHDPRHEEVVRDVACGERAPDAPEVRALHDACEECRHALDALEEPLRRLHLAADAMRQDLAAAARERGAPGEQRIGEMLARARTESASPRSPWRLAAAAVVLLTTAWFVARAFFPPDPAQEPLPLGDGLRCVRPVGSVDAYAPFEWEGSLPAAGWFEVVVRDEAGREHLRSERLETNAYRPSREAEDTLPERIVWEVIARDVGRIHDRAEASATRR